MLFLSYRNAHDLITKILHSKGQENDATDDDLLIQEHGAPLHLGFDTKNGRIGFQGYKQKINQFIL